MSTIYWGQDKLAEALQSATRAYNIRVEDLGAEHKSTKDAAETMEDLRAMIGMGNMAYDDAGASSLVDDDTGGGFSARGIGMSSMTNGIVASPKSPTITGSSASAVGSPPMSPGQPSSKRLSVQQRLPPLGSTPARPSTRAAADDDTPTAI
jgi:hypothetical protein